MSKITEIYEQYKIMPQLAMHQIRVASVAWQLCDSLNVKLDKKSVVIACLLHDMGNIIKSDLNYFPEFSKPEGQDYWEAVKREFTKKYGENEHKATVEIVKEIGLGNEITKLINAIDHKYVEANKNRMSIEEQICVYADNRVTPYKIVSVHERGMEAFVRYKEHKYRMGDESHHIFMKNIEDIEKQIFSHSNIRPEDINNESVAEIIEELKNFEI